MSESDWLAATDPSSMLQFLEGKASNRKLILFVTSVLRQCQTDPRREVAIRFEVAERFADGRMTVSQLRDVWGGEPSFPEMPSFWASSLIQREVTGILVYALPPGSEIGRRLGDIFGNPFRHIAVDPSWRTEAVVGLARGMYESRDFAPMPVLADALEDAGCADADILAHCRGDGPHVRGCWVVDLVLGKS